MSVASKKKKIFDGRYEVLSIVGRGACSVVYHAKNITSPSSEVALKVLLNKQGGTSSTDRLRKEALAMVSSRHKYVIRLDDFHSVQDLCYLSMEYAREGDLRKYKDNHGGKLSVQQAHAFFRQTAEALNFVHRVGITHRDIKPDNILVLNDREIRLTDFGVAVLPGEQASLDELQQGVGTMNYMAPEVLEGKSCDKLSDIYALGLSFYEILTGQHPFENAPLIKQLEVRADKNITHISSLVPGIPKQFAEVLMRCIKYDQDKRFLNMSDLLKALNEFPENEQETESPKPPATQKEPESRTEKKRKPKIATRVSSKPKKIKPSASKMQPVSTAVEEEDQDLDKELEDEIDEILSELEDDTSKDSVDHEIITDKAEVKTEQPAFQDIPKSEPGQIPDEIEDELAEIEAAEAGTSYLRDPRAARQNKAEKEDFSKRSYDLPQEKQNPSFLTTLFVACLILYFSNYLLYKITGYRFFGSSSETSDYANDENQDFAISPASEAITSFPELGAGMYEGSIFDIIPGEESRLVIISLPEKNSLIFIVGAEGWTPALIDLNKAKKTASGKTLRVSSNGYVMDIEASVNNGMLEGTYSNAINGTKGKWLLRPFNK